MHWTTLAAAAVLGFAIGISIGVEIVLWLI